LQQQWEDLQSRLHNIFKIRAERIAFVRGDDDIDFEYVAGDLATGGESVEAFEKKVRDSFGR
jgi:hypothetical protein